MNNIRKSARNVNKCSCDHHHIVGSSLPYVINLPRSVHQWLHREFKPSTFDTARPLEFIAALARGSAGLFAFLSSVADHISDWLLGLQHSLDNNVPDWQNKLPPLFATKDGRDDHK